MRCKPNDIAIIVKASDVPENVGAFVEVICQEDTEKGPHWRVRSTGRLLRGFTVFDEESWRQEMMYPDSSLLPVSPGADPVNIDEPLKLPEKVEA